MDEKPVFLRQDACGHLGLTTALSEVLAEAPAKAAIHKDDLQLVEQFVAQDQVSSDHNRDS